MDAVVSDHDQVLHDLEQRYLSLKHSYENAVNDRETYSGNYDAIAIVTWPYFRC